MGVKYGGTFTGSIPVPVVLSCKLSPEIALQCVDPNLCTMDEPVLLYT